MVNKALLTETIINAPKSTNKSNSNFLSVLYMESGRPYRFTTLCGAKDFLNLSIHIKKDEQSGRWINYICNNEVYRKADPDYSECILCAERDGQGRKLDPPKRVKAFPAFVHDLEGEIRTSKAGKEYEANPINIIMLRAGKGNKNFMSLENLKLRSAQTDIFEPGKYVFEIKKLGTGIETSYEPIELVPNEFLGDEFDRNSKACKEALARFTKKTSDEIYQDILSVCGNVDYPLWGLDEPKPFVVDSKEVTTNKKAKSALST